MPPDTKEIGRTYSSGHTFEVLPGEVGPDDGNAAQLAPGWYGQWSEDQDEGIVHGPFETETDAAMTFLTNSELADGE